MPLNPPLQINDLGLTQHCEGLKLVAYPDGGLWPDKTQRYAIGFGINAPWVKKGMTCTLAQAVQWLRDIMDDRVAMLNRALNIKPNINIFTALGDWAYNEGDGVATSTLIKKANQGDWKGAWDELPKWCYSNHQVDNDLLNRRRIEQAVFIGRDWKEYLTEQYHLPEDQRFAPLVWPENFTLGN